MKKAILGLVFIFISLFAAPFTFAADEFATSYDVTYDVGIDGITSVTEKVNLRNLTSQYYASEFKLTIGATQVSEIKAFDPAGVLEINSEQKDTSTLINVKFNQQVVGLDKTLPWTLQYKSKDFALRQGKIWEVTLPKVVSSLRLDNYKVTLSVPVSFGEPSAITPSPINQVTSGGKMILTFDKEKLKNSGISATFGNHQLYDFDLAYNLENENLVPVLTHIALPPDTGYQDVLYKSFEPKPLNVTVDDDGNYLAWYRLDRGQKVTVKVLGSAKIYSKSKVTNPFLDPKLKQKYTQADKYWEKDSPAIKSKLDEILKGHETASSSAKVKLIYDFVVGNLKYDTSRVTGEDNIERLGAVGALNNPSQAVCMEFTDLFISLVRAAGIPTRELDGYAYTSNSTLRPLSLNKDILHAWPEYWDEKKGWVMVDPTWENTTQGVDYFNKLDLSHFTFVIKGSSSQQPVPAGSYKFIGNEDGKDIKVTLSELDFLNRSNPEVKIEAPDQVIAGFPGKFIVRVNNLGNSIQPSSVLSVNSPMLNVLGEAKQNLGPVPAFGYAEFEYDFRTKSFLDNFEEKIEVNVLGQKLTKNVVVKPFIVFGLFPIIIVGILAFVLAIYLLILGVFFYRKRFKVVESGKNKAASLPAGKPSAKGK